MRIDNMTGMGWTTLGSLGWGKNQFFSVRDIFVR
jgi:hypothetical protein